MCCACTGLLVDRVSRYYKGILEECSIERYSITQYTVVYPTVSTCCLTLVTYSMNDDDDDDD